MVYILQSDKSINYSPENSYGGGVAMPFKIGWFMFDTQNTNQSFWERDEYIEIDSERYRINKSLQFNNQIRAEIVFLRLKIQEMEKNSMSFFMPTRYEKVKQHYKQLVEKYPEYTI